MEVKAKFVSCNAPNVIKKGGKMSKIKFRLAWWGRTVLFQVLEMDERFRSLRDEKERIHRAQNGLVIRSRACPHLSTDNVYLRGVNEQWDDSVAQIEFDDDRKAMEHAENIIWALRDWAENWEGWGNEETETDDDIPNVYEF